jgi:hypothetical protein
MLNAPAAFSKRDRHPLRERVGPERSIETRKGFFAGQRIAEVVGLLLIPIVFYILYRPAILVSHVGSLDPTFYSTAYHNLGDLLDRYGYTSPYYLVRFGLIFPGAVFRAFLEPYAGALALRYCMLLLGCIPVFYLGKRLGGPALGWLGYLLVSTSPLLVRALSDDNPELVAVPYTLAGFALILWNPRPRWLFYGVLGMLFGLAVNSNFFLISTWGLMTLPYLYLAKEQRSFPELIWQVVTDLIVFLVGCGLIQLLGMTVYYFNYGIWKLWIPTIAEVRWLAAGGQKNWKVKGWDWVYTQYVVFLPIVLLLLYTLLRRLRPGTRAGNTAAIWLALVSGFHVFYEYGCGGNVLLFPLYTYFMIPSMLMLALFILKDVHELLGGNVRSACSLVALLLGATLLLKCPVWQTCTVAVRIGSVYIVALSALLAVLICSVAYGTRLLLLTVPLAITLFGVEPWYHAVYRTDTASSSGPQVYRQLVEFSRWMPKYRDDPRKLLFWYSPKSTNGILDTWESTYLWGYARLSNRGNGSPLPPFHLDREEETKLRKTESLGLLAETPADLQTMKAILTEKGIGFRVERARTFHCGRYTVHVELLGITGTPPVNP